MLGCDPGGPMVGPRACTAAADCTAAQECRDGFCMVRMDAGSVVARPDAFIEDAGPRPDTDVAPRCGDGHVRVGEQCDDGATSSITTAAITRA